MPLGASLPRQAQEDDGGGRDGAEDGLPTGWIAHTATNASHGMAFRQNTASASTEHDAAARRDRRCLVEVPRCRRGAAHASARRA